MKVIRIVPLETKMDQIIKLPHGSKILRVYKSAGDFYLSILCDHNPYLSDEARTILCRTTGSEFKDSYDGYAYIGSIDSSNFFEGITL